MPPFVLPVAAFTNAASGRRFETICPRDGSVFAEVAHCGPEDVDRAVRAAREAFEDGRWALLAANL